MVTNCKYSVRVFLFVTALFIGIFGTSTAQMGKFLGKKFQIELECEGCSAILELTRKKVVLQITGPNAARSHWFYFGFTTRSTIQQIQDRICPADILVFGFLGSVPKVQDMHCSLERRSQRHTVLDDVTNRGSNDWTVVEQRDSELGWSVELARDLQTRDSPNLDFSFTNGFPNYLIHTVVNSAIKDCNNIPNLRKSLLSKEDSSLEEDSL